MDKRLSNEQVRTYWDNQAKQHGQNYSASWSDIRVIELEIEEISKYLNTNDRVLDIGCANGFSSVQFAINKTINITGIDYIPEMIDNAVSRLNQIKNTLSGEVIFKVGDALDLKFDESSYDKVIMIRVVINLGDWKWQKKAISEAARVLKPGGLLLLSEATIQGYNRLNALRNEFGLPLIPMPNFNNYLDEKRVIVEVSDKLNLVSLNNYASTYYLGTRFIKPLIAKLSNIPIDVSDPNMEWNRLCSLLPPIGDYGTQKLFIFKRI